MKNLFTILEISFHLVCKSSSLPPISIYNCEQIYLQLLLEVLQQYINTNLQLSLVTISIFITNIFTTIPRIQFCLSEKMPNRHSSNQHLFEKQQKSAMFIHKRIPILYWGLIFTATDVKTFRSHEENSLLRWKPTRLDTAHISLHIMFQLNPKLFACSSSF